jgi:hypothetical protein
VGEHIHRADSSALLATSCYRSVDEQTNVLSRESSCIQRVSERLLNLGSGDVPFCHWPPVASQNVFHWAGQVPYLVGMPREQVSMDLNNSYDPSILPKRNPSYSSSTLASVKVGTSVSLGGVPIFARTSCDNVSGIWKTSADPPGEYRI